MIVNILPPHNINLKTIRKLIMKNLIPIFFHSNCDITNRINRQLNSRTDPSGVYVNKPSIILVYRQNLYLSFEVHSCQMAEFVFVSLVQLDVDKFKIWQVALCEGFQRCDVVFRDQDERKLRRVQPCEGLDGINFGLAHFYLLQMDKVDRRDLFYPQMKGVIRNIENYIVPAFNIGKYFHVGLLLLAQLGLVELEPLALEQLFAVLEVDVSEFISQQDDVLGSVWLKSY